MAGHFFHRALFIGPNARSAVNEGRAEYIPEFLSDVPSFFRRGILPHKASGIRVGEVMSRPPVTVLLSTSLAEAARKMVDERVHRVVVVDYDQRPIGVLSAMDFVTLYAEEPIQ